MHRLHRLLLALAFAAFTLSASAAEQPPALAIGQALKIAQDYLQQHGAAADHQIIGLTLERATLHATYWYARWSSAIGDGPKKETGLRIDMDGTITRFVSGPSEQAPPGQRRIGARDIRGGG